MTPSPRTLVFCCALLALAAVPGAALAQEGPAGRFLKGQHERVNRILARDASSDAARTRRSDAVRRVIADLLDYQSLSREALGTHWDEHSEQERSEFVDLLQHLVERSYQSNLESTSSYRIRYGTEDTRGDSVIVHTTARSTEHRRAPEVAIDYRMHREGRRWVVVDVVTDGVSMVRNYHSQFDRIIRRDGWDGLLGRMRSRLNEAGAI